MITVKQLNKIYKGALYETQALKDVSFQITDGEFVSVMGDSGAGKTTLLNILGGMDSAASGEVWYNEENILTMNVSQMDKWRKRNISFIFQHFALMEEYSVYDNLEAPLLARNMRKRERKDKINDIAQELGIDGLLYQYPSQISGGQKQRVAIARCVISDCPVILADEPTGALDETNTANVMQLLQGLHKTGKTIIVITHDKKVAEYTNRTIVLKDGQFVSQPASNGHIAQNIST